MHSFIPVPPKKNQSAFNKIDLVSTRQKNESVCDLVLVTVAHSRAPQAFGLMADHQDNRFGKEHVWQPCALAAEC